VARQAQLQVDLMAAVMAVVQMQVPEVEHLMFVWVVQRLLIGLLLLAAAAAAVPVDFIILDLRHLFQVVMVVVAQIMELTELIQVLVAVDLVDLIVQAVHLESAVMLQLLLVL
jgi:hypothetical protein